MLQTAIALLKAGYPLPLDMAAKLLAAGFDVEALERKYAR
jgi:hypothetical protein